MFLKCIKAGILCGDFLENVSYTTMSVTVWRAFLNPYVYKSLANVPLQSMFLILVCAPTHSNTPTHTPTLTALCPHGTTGQYSYQGLCANTIINVNKTLGPSYIPLDLQGVETWSSSCYQRNFLWSWLSTLPSAQTVLSRCES